MTDDNILFFIPVVLTLICIAQMFRPGLEIVVRFLWIAPIYLIWLSYLAILFLTGIRPD